ncbi:MAG: hypothetical protein BWK80_36510 [Desulfobacteraceae bacterium IS3]|nr:MAG: hypothetical protein BWK80_36510 [Desulfobacteraceae bacterium IS3]
MSLSPKDYNTDEFKAFFRELIRNDIKEMIRAEIISLSRELPKTTLEAVVLQQLLDKVQKHGEATDELTEDLADTRKEMNQRFEQVNQRFERADLRFEKIEHELADTRKEMNQRFEKVDQRFDDVIRNFDDLKSWVGIVVGRFQNRAGKSLEDMAAGTLRLALKRKDIVPESIKLRQKIKDSEGIIGPEGRGYEVDILAEGNSLLVFEVKSYCDLEMAERFADKVMLMKHLHPDKTTDAALIILEPAEEILEYCRKHQIAVVN